MLLVAVSALLVVGHLSLVRSCSHFFKELPDSYPIVGASEVVDRCCCIQRLDKNMARKRLAAIRYAVVLHANTVR